MTTIRVGHSPDPDDAFMVWALAEGIVNADDFDVELVPRDIESLNRWAVEEALLESTALSAAAFARVADTYWLLPHGGSFGDGYGPVVVARKEMRVEDLSGLTVAAPGELTTAFAALRLAAPGAQAQHRPFDKILPEVQKGRFEAGLLIHEGQITWAREGVRGPSAEGADGPGKDAPERVRLHKVVDLGAWWKQETGLPLPLGVTALRKDLGRELGADVNHLLKASIETGLAMRGRALAYARRFGRGIAEEDTDRFVSMYVNDMTLDMGETGLRAVRELHRRCAAAGLLPRGARVETAPD